VKEGKVKYLGLCEASPAEVRAAHAVHPISAVQLDWSLWTRDAEVGSQSQTLSPPSVGPQVSSTGVSQGARHSLHTRATQRSEKAVCMMETSPSAPRMDCAPRLMRGFSGHLRRAAQRVAHLKRLNKPPKAANCSRLKSDVQL